VNIAGGVLKKMAGAYELDEYSVDSLAIWRRGENMHIMGNVCGRGFNKEKEGLQMGWVVVIKELLYWTATALGKKKKNQPAG